MEDFDDNQDYQEDAEQIDDELLGDEQDIEDSQDDEQDADGEETESEDDSADDVLDFSFDDDGDSSDPFRGQEAPEWVKKVREENRELERQLKQRESQQFEQQVLREKPTLDDHDYDSDAFEQDYAQWLTEKQQVDAQVLLPLGVYLCINLLLFCKPLRVVLFKRVTVIVMVIKRRLLA